ncbi:unnamed protein product, partial [Dovyalis caffra]
MEIIKKQWLPKKIGVLVRKVQKDAILAEAKVRRNGISLASKYLCYMKANEET